MFYHNSTRRECMSSFILSAGGSHLGCGGLCWPCLWTSRPVWSSACPLWCGGFFFNQYQYSVLWRGLNKPWFHQRKYTIKFSFELLLWQIKTALIKEIRHFISLLSGNCLFWQTCFQLGTNLWLFHSLTIIFPISAGGKSLALNPTPRQSFRSQSLLRER